MAELYTSAINLHFINFVEMYFQSEKQIASKTVDMLSHAGIHVELIADQTD